MMSGKNFWYAFILLALAVVTTSCNDDEEEAFEALADVYYINKMADGEMLHGVYYYAYGNKAIESVNVTTPGGESFVLEQSFNLGTTLASEPDSADYTATLPEEGNYLFDITGKNGEVTQVNEMLELSLLPIPEFTQISYNSFNYGYDVEWDDVEAADAYLVRILDEEGNAVFNSYTVNEDVNEYEIVQSANGYWDKTPHDNQVYYFQILAYTFDEGADNSNFVYNIEQISLGETQVVWGEE